MTDSEVEAQRAELARVERAYDELSATLALAKAEKGLDPTPEHQERLRGLKAEWSKLLRALTAREEALASERREASPSEPEGFSFCTLGLPDFAETSVDWEEGRLMVCRREGVDERQVEVRPTPAQWERFWSALQSSRAFRPFRATKATRETR